MAVAGAILPHEVTIFQQGLSFTLSFQQPSFWSQETILTTVSPKAKGLAQPSGGVSRGGGGLTPLALRSTKFCMISRSVFMKRKVAGPQDSRFKERNRIPMDVNLNLEYETSDECEKLPAVQVNLHQWSNLL
ncbi:hypothetical protein L1887_04674 [Cichorium endivia]|nr:hypothetical protein L1887_04674 [Cichorium endivia]